MLNSQAEEPSLETPQELPEEETAELYPLSPRKEAALHALLTYPTNKEAALAAGISEPTLWRYMRDPVFARRLNEARREGHAQAVQRLHHAAGDAAKALHDIVKDSEAPHAARISAARAIFDQLRRAIELDEQRVRIDELEQHILRKQEQDAIDRAREEEEEEV